MVKASALKRIRSAQTQVNLPVREHADKPKVKVKHVSSAPAVLQSARSDSNQSLYFDADAATPELENDEFNNDQGSHSRGSSPVPSLKNVTGSNESLTTVRTMLGHETWYKIVRDISFPVLVVGFSLGTSGILFQTYRNRKDDAFNKIRELSVMVAPLFRLKNNLEIVGVSKLSMELNLGGLKTKSEKVNFCIADLCISQVQSIVAGFAASFIAILIVYLHNTGIPVRTEIIYTTVASSVLTAATTTFVFGIITFIMIFILFHFHINPDNVGVPLTIALSDISTMVTLHWTSNYFQDVQHSNMWIVPFTLGILSCSVPFWAFLHYWYEGSLKPLFDCWIPFLSSISLSCLAGAIVDLEADKYPDIILYLELITGVTGVLVSIHYCRVMTSYHRVGKMGVIPKIGKAEGKVCYNPIEILFRLGIHSTGFWVFFIAVFPAQTLFSVFMFQIAPDHARECYPSFLWMYILSCGLHILFLLIITMFATNLLWKCKIDPAVYVIPFIHGLGDVLGTGLLTLVCHMLARVQNCQMNEREGHDHASKQHSLEHAHDHPHKT